VRVFGVSQKGTKLSEELPFYLQDKRWKQNIFSRNVTTFLPEHKALELARL
jgi:hypothetical protein